MRRTTVTSFTVVSPFDQLDAALLQLAAESRPLSLPSELMSESEPGVFWPVDLVRARMAHPSTPSVVRDRVWWEIVRRRLMFGEPWGTVGVAMALPSLRRALARLPRLAEMEHGELEQEVLAAVTEELVALDPYEKPVQVGLRLVRAGDRAAHRVVYAALRERRLRPQPLDEGSVVPQPWAGGSQAQVYAVLERAVGAGVLSSAEAELIAGTRLDGLSAQAVASAAGISVRAMFRRRAAAEHRLAKGLFSGDW
ncbi:hypothetical protein ABCR94_17730 [Streptomyces sp. 21So2-11]|uniref:hypothetical protein n=1 Tax=Streptomyces sp. 21So2-11 TaxID=3144408 RepID=UPI003219FAE6